MVTGETPDISEWTDFGFYDHVWYRTNAGLAEIQLGRWLGVSKRVGPAMSFWILTANCDVISCTTVQRVTNLERQTDDSKRLIADYDEAVRDRLADQNHQVAGYGLDEPAGWTVMPDLDDAEFVEEHDQAIGDGTIPEADDQFTPDSFDDTYLNMEVALPGSLDGNVRAGRVVKRMRDANGIPTGVANENPLLDTRLYEVQFVDGSQQALVANAIAMNMFAQVDEEGHRHVMLKEISDFRKDASAVTAQDAMFTMPNGTVRRRQTTKGWSLLAEWKDGSSNWIPLKDLKNSHPLEVAEFAVASRIAEEPAFAWWVPYTLRKRNRIIAKVKKVKGKYHLPVDSHITK
jgi:hypothetical protein